MTVVDWKELIRWDRMPHILCPGCGNGTILNVLVRVLAEKFEEGELDPDKTVLVSGIGCSSRLPGYVKLDSLHTTHGRPLAFATGIKLANPDLEVIVITGDGDAAAIGGNHLIHAARRNLDVTVICANNYIYGMTGGQVSPTTPRGAKSTTTPYGNPEPPFDLCELVIGAGAPHVERWTTAHPAQLSAAIARALEREGFSFIDVLCQCPTNYGRRNDMRDPREMVKWLRENTSTRDEEGKIRIGILRDEEREPFLKRMYDMIEEVRTSEEGD
ncbi:2-oxoacid:ferredoxin oxidoreductase subunit beta [Methanopyrus sp. SNP6]|uniref:thiamine pyrophosphate-dependent enzyme n=1 Tax=Methanopyrus sp. SNP6 TaxID=1937005 RepID=UPI0011E5C795